MICKNCGGEYSDEALHCPYCHTENKKVAARQKKAILNSYDIEAEKIKEQAKQYPQKTVNKWTRYIFVGMGILVAVGFTVTMISILATKIGSNHKYAKMQSHKQKLEEMLTGEDYEGIKEYMAKEELYSYGYENYWQIQDAYTQCVNIEESIAGIVTLEDDIYKSREEWELYIEYDISRILRGAEILLFYYEDECRDDVFRGNEAALESICEQGLGLLEEFNFSEEEMREIKLGSESSQKEVLIQKLEDYFWSKEK